jgi:hypothetical protein
MTPIEDVPTVTAVIRELAADHLAGGVNVPDAAVTPATGEEKSA